MYCTWARTVGSVRLQRCNSPLGNNKKFSAWMSGHDFEWSAGEGSSLYVYLWQIYITFKLSHCHWARKANYHVKFLECIGGHIAAWNAQNLTGSYAGNLHSVIDHFIWRCNFVCSLSLLGINLRGNTLKFLVYIDLTLPLKRILLYQLNS